MFSINNIEKFVLSFDVVYMCEADSYDRNVYY